jgi:hypothetical protein
LTDTRAASTTGCGADEKVYGSVGRQLSKIARRELGCDNEAMVELLYRANRDILQSKDSCVWGRP